MPDQFDARERELRAIARAAHEEAQRGLDVEADLRAVRARVAAGDDGVGPSPPTAPSRATWTVWAAAAAVVALVAGGVLLTRLDDGPDTLRTQTPPTAPDSAPPTTPDTVPPTAVEVPLTTLGGVPTSLPVETPTTDSSDPAPPTTSLGEPTAADALPIGVRCLADQCTRLANTNDGGIVAFDPIDQTLTVLDPAGTTVESVVPLAERLVDAYLLTVGPDDVAYFLGRPAVDPGDPVLDLVAIPLAGANAGTIVQRLPGVDGSGDSDLVPTPGGLVPVGCCGPEPVRPDPARSFAYGWVDRNGEPVAFDGPVFRIVTGDGGNDLVRVDGGTSRTFALPTVASNPRGMPEIVATDDGGALMLVQHQPTPDIYVVRFRPEQPAETVDNTDVFLASSTDEFPSAVALLRPDGSVVVRDGDRFVIEALGQAGTAGWGGRVETDLATWTVIAPGLNDDIAANSPAWAATPDTLAVQLVPQIGPSERFSSFYDEATAILTITVEGFLDDSVLGVQYTFEMTRAGDGYLRVGSGTWANRCQPNRGHQDYRPELCV